MIANRCQEFRLSAAAAAVSAISYKKRAIAENDVRAITCTSSRSPTHRFYVGHYTHNLEGEPPLVAAKLSKKAKLDNE